MTTDFRCSRTCASFGLCGPDTPQGCKDAESQLCTTKLARFLLVCSEKCGGSSTAPHPICVYSHGLSAQSTRCPGPLRERAVPLHPSRCHRLYLPHAPHRCHGMQPLLYCHVHRGRGDVSSSSSASSPSSSAATQKRTRKGFVLSVIAVHLLQSTSRWCMRACGSCDAGGGYAWESEASSSARLPSCCTAQRASSAEGGNAPVL